MPKPLLIYDGDCGFCKKWIGYWQTLTGEAVRYAPYQEVGAQYPQIPRQAFERAVQLVRSDGSVTQGAEAVFETLAVRPGRNPIFKWALWGFRRIPGVRAVCEFAYRTVARNRVVFSWLTYLLWGDHLEPSRMALTRRIFLAALGCTYVAAFVSFRVQSPGLVGSQGILPAPELPLPISWVCGIGIASAVLLVAGVFPTLALTVAWVCYGWVVQAGQEFLGFQWDTLMLEMGFFSFFLTLGASRPSRLSVLVMRWLLFRVVFFSGYVKLASHDPIWRGLTALDYHFESQPLPTWIGWWFHQFSPQAHKVLTVGVFVFELGIPFLYFLPRRPRIVAFWATLFLQIVIDLTGNYGFFGWQVVALSLLLLDDAFFERMSWLKRLSPRICRPFWALRGTRAVMDLVIGAGGAAVIFFTTVIPLDTIKIWMSPLNVIHDYGVFAVMTTRRGELIFEGSQDGRTWQPYELKWKPGDLSRRPAFCEPHMPRLDWQLWFAALGTLDQNPWVENLAVRLLQGSQPVLALFERNPFPEVPPKFVRATFYLYHFTDIAERAKTGHWWRREELGTYLPPVSLTSL